jgi:hypothetical protein
METSPLRDAVPLTAKRVLRLKAMPPDDRKIQAIIKELDDLFFRLPHPSTSRQVRNLLAMLVKKRFDLSIRQNKTRATARTLYVTVVLEPKPWLVKLVKTLRILARNRNRKIKHRR